MYGVFKSPDSDCCALGVKLYGSGSMVSSVYGSFIQTATDEVGLWYYYVAFVDITCIMLCTESLCNV
jgi:hypothetical protein